ncbi:MAG: hypothetical protein AAGE59_12535 [Cyanobacteria bacterium P01_F01_bin.86]
MLPVLSQIRYRLLLLSLLVLPHMLTVFAIAMGTVFAHRLNQALRARLETLARTTAL